MTPNPMAASFGLLQYAMEMAEKPPRPAPRNDIVTTLVSGRCGTVPALTSDEFGFFVLLLAVAGNETTRNAISPRA